MIKHYTTALIFTALLLFGLSLGHTQEKKYSVTFSPFHLITAGPLEHFNTVLELTGEYAFQSKISAAGILGYGRYKGTSNFEDETLSILEVGGQLRYYAWGNFNLGIPVGVEVLMTKAFMTENKYVTLPTNGLGAGPFVGLKWTHAAGFTIDAQVGYQKIVGQEKARDKDMNQEIDSSIDSDIILWNFNLGWSF